MCVCVHVCTCTTVELLLLSPIMDELKRFILTTYFTERKKKLTHNYQVLASRSILRQKGRHISTLASGKLHFQETLKQRDMRTRNKDERQSDVTKQRRTGQNQDLDLW